MKVRSSNWPAVLCGTFCALYPQYLIVELVGTEVPGQSNDVDSQLGIPMLADLAQANATAISAAQSSGPY